MNHCLFNIFQLEALPETYEEQASRKHLQKSFEFIWLEEGSGLNIIDRNQYVLQPRSFYCIAPGLGHQLLLHPGAKGHLVSFTREFLLQQNNMQDGLEEAQLQRQFILYPEINVPENHAEELADLLSVLLKEKQRNPLLRNDIVYSYLRIFLLLIGKQIVGTDHCTVKTGNRLVSQFLSLIEKNFKERWTVTNYAGALFVTPNYLNNVIKSVTGYTASYHIQQRVLLEAKLELRKKGTSMKQIAFELGFEDMGHFSKFFKNTAGESFSDFRRQLGKSLEAA